MSRCGLLSVDHVVGGRYPAMALGSRVRWPAMPELHPTVMARSQSHSPPDAGVRCGLESGTRGDLCLLDTKERYLDERQILQQWLVRVSKWKESLNCQAPGNT
jgi:hypothetical protein